MGTVFKATLMAPAISGDPAWVTKPTFETNWTIVKNTQVYGKKSADVDALIKALAGFRPGAPYSDKIVKSGRLSPAQIALFREIDAELSVRGLRFHHAFYALPIPKELSGETKFDDDDGPRDDIARVHWYRLKNIPKPAAFIKKPSPLLAPAQEALAAAKDAAEQTRALAYSTSSKPFSEVSRPTDDDVAEAEARVKEHEAWVDYVKTSGQTYSYGGDRNFHVTGDAPNTLPDRTLASIDPLDSYIREQLKPHVETLQQSVVDAGYTEDVAKEYVTMAITTFARYFSREGCPNAINTTDGTFTYGCGLNTYGGAGVDFLNDLAMAGDPKSSRIKNDFNRVALRQARAFLLRCGIAVLPTEARSPSVRILHFEEREGPSIPVPYVLQTMPFVGDPPPLKALPPKPVKPTQIDEWSYPIKKQIYDYEKKSWDEAKVDAAAHNERVERLQALEYLRRNETLLTAWVMLGSKETPPGVNTKLVKPYRIVSAIVEAAFITFVDATKSPKFPLWFLVRAGRGTKGAAKGKLPSGTAAFTFLHHIAWWGWGGFPNVTDAMRWAIARGFVKTDLGRKAEAKKGAKYIGMDGKTYDASQAPDDDDEHRVSEKPFPDDDADPAYKKAWHRFTDPDKYYERVDIEGELDADKLKGVRIEDSLATPIGLVRGVFTYIEMRKRLASRADTGYWSTLCKLWSNFLSDLKEERDIKLALPSTVVMPDGATFRDKKSGQRKVLKAYSRIVVERGERYVRWYVKLDDRTSMEIELPSEIHVSPEGEVNNTLVMVDDPYDPRVEAKVSTQSRLAVALGTTCAVFPFETAEQLVRRIEDEFVDEIGFIYKGYCDDDDVPTIKRGKDSPLMLTDAAYKHLTDDVRASLNEVFSFVSLSKAAAKIAKDVSEENSDTVYGSEAATYLSDLDPGVYAVGMRRDEQEIDVGRLGSWEALYRLKKITF